MRYNGYGLKASIPEGAKILCACIFFLTGPSRNERKKWTYLLKRGYSEEEYQQLLLNLEAGGDIGFVDEGSVVWFEDGSWLERVDTGEYYHIWHHTSTPEIPEGL